MLNPEDMMASYVLFFPTKKTTTASRHSLPTNANPECLRKAPDAPEMTALRFSMKSPFFGAFTLHRRRGFLAVTEKTC